jgi:CheY-like chemotaxis protein/anti-sigma regulatory factor (Ser/Thr protein kinase)
VELSGLVGDCVDLLRGLGASDDSSGGIEARLEPSVWVRADPGALERCVINLVTNAFEAAGGSGRVMVEVRGEEHAAWISVQDDGPGMDAATLARCRESGFTTKGASGTGLGLGIVGAILAAHGGQMRIESEPGLGTRVELELKRTAPARIATDPEHASTASSTPERARLVLVEDEPAVSEVVAEMCAMAGFEVEVAHTAAAGRRLCAERSPEVVVIDEGLPDLSGLELANRIRQEHRSVGIVLLSGRIDADRSSSPSPIDIACSKPVSYERLREILIQARRCNAERAHRSSPPGESEATA